MEVKLNRENSQLVHFSLPMLAVSVNAVEECGRALVVHATLRTGTGRSRCLIKAAVLRPSSLS